MALSIPLNPQDQQRIQVGIFFYKYSAATASWVADGRNDPVTPTNPAPTVIFKNIVEKVGLIEAVVGRMILAPIVDRVLLKEAIFSQVVYRLNDNLALSESISHDGPTLSADFRTVITPWVFVATQGIRPVDVVAFKEVISYLGQMAFSDQSLLAEAITLAGRMDKSDAVFFGEGVGAESFEPPPTSAGTVADSAAISESRTIAAALNGGESIATPSESRTFVGTLSQSDAISLSEAQSWIANTGPAEILTVSESRVIAAVYAMAEQFVITDLAMTSGTLTRAESVSIAEANSNASTNTTGDALAMNESQILSGTFSKAEFFTFSDGVSVQGFFTKTEVAAVVDGFSVQQVAAPAGISVKQISNPLRSGTDASIASTFPSSVTAGSMLIVVVSTYLGGTNSVVGSRNGAFTKVHATQEDPYNETQIFIKAGAAAGTETVTITPGDPGNGYISGRMIEVAGITAVDRLGAANNSYTVSASAANTTANSFVLATAVHDTGGNAGFGGPTGYTLLDRENDSDSYTGSQSSYKIVSAIETSSATITSNTGASNVDSLIITFRP